ncbi:MAG: hypothetical protein QXF61_03035 [Nitrososphaeria archaeon]
MGNSEYKVLTLKGKLIGLSDVRKIQSGVREFQVSQATFLIETSNGPRHAFMFLWDYDAPKIRELSLGASYEFSAVVKEGSDQMIMFFLPNSTQFRTLVNGERTL